MTETPADPPQGDRRLLPLDEELAGRVAWLVRLRWFAGIAVLAMTGVAALVPKITLPWMALLAGGVLILAYNLIFLAILRRFKRNTNTPAQNISRLASAQFITDWIALTILVHLTGGLGSPILFFFVFHAILASILLPPRPAWFHAAAGVLLVSLLVALEYSGVIPQRPIQGFISVPASNPLIAAGMLIFFASSIFGTFYLAGSIAKRLWARTRDLADAAARVQAAYNQTRTINEIGRTVASSLDLDEVLDRILASSIAAVSADAGSIRLVDPDTGRWWTRVARGMPESFLKIQDDVSPLQGPFNRRLMEGEPVVVADVAGTHGCLFPGAAREAGLKAMLAVPLRSAGITIGVLKIYTHDPRIFSEEDTAFLTALASQVVAAVESARAYRRLENLDATKSRFFFMAAHELKSPVAAVQSSLDLLKEGYLGDLPENQRNVIERTHIRLGGLRALLADLMDMGSLGSRTAGDRTAIDFDALVRRMSDVLRLDADNKGINLQVSVGSDRKIVASERHIERVVENLVGNAIKYTPDGGRVDVAVVEEGDELLFRVSDSGVGISAEALPHIFDEFYRAEGVRHTHEGTGLGLALVKKICDMYGGHIDVISEPGVGTTFTVRLRCDA